MPCFSVREVDSTSLVVTVPASCRQAQNRRSRPHLLTSGKRSLVNTSDGPYPHCCVEAECHFYYLRDSSVYVHESCCPGDQRHLPTYVGPGRLPDGPPTKYGS